MNEQNGTLYYILILSLSPRRRSFYKIFLLLAMIKGRIDKDNIYTNLLWLPTATKTRPGAKGITSTTPKDENRFINYKRN